MMEDGFLCVNKPRGITSFDALQVILREILNGKSPKKRVKIGHAGTLDPLAEGVLVVALNRATKLIRYVQQQPKTYVATFLLGVESDSEDTETEMRKLENVSVPTKREIMEKLSEFTGEILQMPPAYSALKIKGKRAYDLARKGKKVELTPRPIKIFELKLLEYEYPLLKLEIICGSGTYIRSLGRDFARSLGTSAVMSELTRTAVGVFYLDDAVQIRIQKENKIKKKEDAQLKKDNPVMNERGASSFSAEIMHMNESEKLKRIKDQESPESEGDTETIQVIQKAETNFESGEKKLDLQDYDSSGERGDFLRTKIRPVRDAVPEWPVVFYDEEKQKLLRNGVPVPVPEEAKWMMNSDQKDFVVLSQKDGSFLALVHMGEDGRLRSTINFT